MRSEGLFTCNLLEIIKKINLECIKRFIGKVNYFRAQNSVRTKKPQESDVKVTDRLHESSKA